MATRSLAWACMMLGVAMVALGLWDRMQTCEQVASDVFICTYTALNYLIAATGGVLFAAGVVRLRRSEA